MVPDGSGAIIEFAEKAGITYSQSVWGNDMAVESSATSVMLQNVGIPVFGHYYGAAAVFAEISGSAAVATVHAEVCGNEIPQNHIFAEFNVLSFDTSDTGGQRRMAVFNIYSQDYVAEFPQVRYTLYDMADVTYSDMAESYRNHLIEDGILKERLEEAGSLPVYIDFTGYETVDESFLGIAVKERLALSTLDDIENVLDELESRGMSDIHLRMKAYSDGGLYGTAPNDFSIDRCVGTTEELDALASRLLKAGGYLYLENNFSTVHTESDSYNAMKHAVRSLKKTVISAFDYDLVSRKDVDAVNKFYLTSPAYYMSLTENFVDDLKKESEDFTLYGYSWSDFGSKLWSDFSKEHSYDRTQTVDTMCNAMAKAEENFASIMTDGSNAYALSAADVLLNIPLSASGLSCESYSIPFYQMVIHGYVDYAGAPLNVGGDMGKNYLASIESGGGLYYSFYTAEDELLKKTALP